MEAFEWGELMDVKLGAEQGGRHALYMIGGRIL